MRDVVAEYKESLKQLDSSFDGDYYDRLILSEPLTPTPEDPVGFDQLDPIGTLGTTAEPSANQVTVPTEALVAPTEAPIQQPVEPIANQSYAPMTSQPVAPAVEQPTDPPAA